MADHCCHSSEPAHGHAAAPASLAPLVATQAVGQALRTPLRILQMDCPTEEGLIRARLKGMPGVHALRFNLMQRVLTVDHAADALPSVLAALREIGFRAELPGEEMQTAPSGARTSWLLGLAALAALTAEMAHWFPAPGWLVLLTAVLAVVLSGTSTYRKGLIALRQGKLNINALMSIAVTGALLLGQWPEAAMVMVLFAIAEAIEARSLDKARDSVERLMAVAPDHVSRRQADGSWASVAVRAVAVGDVLRVLPGERIGLDGVVVHGHGEVNQAPITGESALIERKLGDGVYAGSINGMGELEIQVTAAADDTVLAHIIHSVHDAQSRRAPIQRFVDRFAAVYTPLVCLLALVVAVVPPLAGMMAWREAAYMALVLLVIACPCALVISTPVAIVSALGAAARQGMLIKGGAFLEQGRHLRWLALDKTGTLTSGRPSLLDLRIEVPESGGAPVQALARALALRSDHPVSRAIVRGLAAYDGQARLANDNDLPVLHAVRAWPGQGSGAEHEGEPLYLGNPDWIATLLPQGAATTGLAQYVADARAQGRTVSVLADGRRVLAVFVVADTLRETSRQALAELHDLGVRTLMLTGDNAATAQAVAAQAGVETVRADLLPHDKLAIIEDLSGQGRVGMVGDGINDAPALARADIGFAMGVIGSDTALETADVALMDDDLRKLGQFIRLSRATHRILVQNISLALGIKLVFVIITLMGLATMWMAVFADVGASLIVLANSLRLLPGVRPAPVSP
ncbi:MAG: heavy metal translocating P-type ATPase [Castellaniella sp.]